MCEIQFVMSHNINDEEIGNFLDMLTEGSYSNSDATGLCTDNGTKWKFRNAIHRLKDKKTDHLLRDIRMNTNKFLIGHNRLATTGDEKFNKNNHPFETPNIMLVHNGIISNHMSLKGDFSLDYKEETDSAIVPYLLETYLTLPDTDIVSAIKETAESLQGSYSILLLHKPSGRTFYFKNNSTSFSFMKTITKSGKVSLYGSTKDQNLLNCYDWEKDGMFNVDTLRKSAFAEPEAGVIYEITEKGLNLEEVGKFSPFTYTTTGIRTAYGNGTTYGGTTKYYSDWRDDYGWNDYASVPETGGTELLELPSSYQKQLDHDIQEHFEEMLEEMAYLMANDNLIDDISKCNIRFHRGARQITVENITKDAVKDLDTYLTFREWCSNTNPMGTRNITITFDEIHDFVDNYGHKIMNSGGIK